MNTLSNGGEYDYKFQISNTRPFIQNYCFSKMFRNVLTAMVHSSWVRFPTSLAMLTVVATYLLGQVIGLWCNHGGIRTEKKSVSPRIVGSHIMLPTISVQLLWLIQKKQTLMLVFFSNLAGDQ